MGQGGTRGEGSKVGQGYVILGFRVPTTSVGARVERVMRSEGAKGSKAYCILGFRVPTTSVGARGEGSKGVRGAK